jgi:hypothetical protein
VANTYPVWRACCNNSDAATEAAASDCVHSAITESVVVVRPNFQFGPGMGLRSDAIIDRTSAAGQAVLPGRTMTSSWPSGRS